MKLLFLGAPRTATTSLFNLLEKHPTISSSKIKEPFNKSPYKDDFPFKYFDNFLINEKIDFLLDGTPCAYSFFKEKVKEIPLNKYIIYPVRNPFDRLYSTLKQTIMTHHYYKNKYSITFPPYIKGDLKIDCNEILKYIPNTMDSVYIEHAFEITNDVFIFRLDQLNLTNIFDFLNIQTIDEDLGLYNKLEIWNNDEYTEIRKDIDVFLNNNYISIAKLILNDLYKIKNKVFVEDWIEETKNILSDV